MNTEREKKIQEKLNTMSEMQTEQKRPKSKAEDDEKKKTRVTTTETAYSSFRLYDCH